MRRLIVVLILAGAALAGAALAQPAPRAVEVLRAFGRLAQQPLWPGFEPQKIAVELYDGTDTYLYHHPKPPEGFTAMAGAPGVYVFHGQHDSVRANTGIELNGVPTATADISKDTRPPREAASLLIHEAFHVYEKAAHPKWAANEAELFTYPVDDAKVLNLRRLETIALVHALAAKTVNEARIWGNTAVYARDERMMIMSPGAMGYERGTELSEGLAQYVEYRSIGKAAALTAEDFPAEEIRKRGYATGQAMALLLDRIRPSWKSHWNGEDPLDLVLVCQIDSKMTIQIPEPERVATLERAQRETAAVAATRARRKHDFFAAPGWRLEIVAGAEPLWPQGFDPWNVQNLGDNDILHTRWVKVGNKSGAIEIMSHASLTEGVGPHPLFNGAKRLVVTGLGPVSFTDKDGKLAITSDAAKGTFAGASVTQQGQVVTVQLP